MKITKEIVGLFSFFAVLCDEDPTHPVECLISALGWDARRWRTSCLFGDLRWWHTREYYVLCFGAYGDTLVATQASSLDDALEQCAEVLPKGHFCDLEYDKCPHCGADIGSAWVEEASHECECGETVTLEAIEADTTYTESGHLPSYEWGITLDSVGLWDVVDAILEAQ